LNVLQTLSACLADQLGKAVDGVLPRLILHIDFASGMGPRRRRAGFIPQGDESDAIYIVLNGRLRSVLEKADGKMQVLGEYGQARSIVSWRSMTESTASGDFSMPLNTELAKFPRTLFNNLAQEHPGITIRYPKLIASNACANLVDDRFMENRTSPTTAIRQDRNLGRQLPNVANFTSYCRRCTGSGITNRLVNAFPIRWRS